MGNGSYGLEFLFYGLKFLIPNFEHVYRHAIETPEGDRLDLIFFEILPTVRKPRLVLV